MPPGYPTLRSRNAISSPGVHSIILLRLLFVVLPISPSLCLCRSRKSARRLSSAQTHTHARAPVFSLSLSLSIFVSVSVLLSPSLSLFFRCLRLACDAPRDRDSPSIGRLSLRLCLGSAFLLVAALSRVHGEITGESLRLVRFRPSARQALDASSVFLSALRQDSRRGSRRECRRK